MINLPTLEGVNYETQEEKIYFLILYKKGGHWPPLILNQIFKRENPL
jgi:hypothetical protein